MCVCVCIHYKYIIFYILFYEEQKYNGHLVSTYVFVDNALVIIYYTVVVIIIFFKLFFLEENCRTPFD